MIEAFAIPDIYAAEAALAATLPEGELMARAVAGLVDVITARMKERHAARLVALVGPGNNGGDALYAAAALAQTGVDVAAVYRPGHVHEGALAQARGAVELIDGDDADAATRVLTDSDVVLDGILGMGGRAGLPMWARPWVAVIPDEAYVVAVDVPSGHDPAGEALDAEGVFADETITFSAPKPVHLSPLTEAAVGLLTVMEIGLERPGDPVIARVTRSDVADLWPVPGPHDDKYSRGVVGVVAGSETYSGAAILTTSAAAACGVGMIRYVGAPTPTALVRAAVPEAVIGDGRVQAWVIGPGLDAASEQAGDAQPLAHARAALRSTVPVVIDAGGLDLLASMMSEQSWRRTAPTLLTPHAGECARLLGSLTGGDMPRADVAAQPARYARQLAELTGATVLLKGATTIVATPGAGPLFTQCDAPAWLATAGAGDVLAGMLGALLAAGLEPHIAAALGALVHGVAADEANPGGPIRAGDVARQLSATIARLLRR